MNKNTLITIAVVVVIFLLAFLYAWFKPSPEVKVLKLEQEVERLQYQKDSLLLQLEQKDSVIFSLQERIENTKTKIIYLSENKNEKVDSVYSLPIDGAIEFFTNQVSAEANSTRRYNSGDNL